MRRNNLDICADILKAARRGARKTKIVYQANLNFKIVEKYLRNLVLGGYLETDGRGVYLTTPRGNGFIQQYEELLSLMPEAPSRPVDLGEGVMNSSRAGPGTLLNGGGRRR